MVYAPILTVMVRNEEAIPIAIEAHLQEKGLSSTLTQALVRQRSRVKIPAKAYPFLQKKQETKAFLNTRLEAVLSDFGHLRYIS